MKLLWSIRKELTLLSRDTAGLLVLFVMPVVLVIVVTLVQENVLKSMGETKMRILLIDNDRGSVGMKIENAIGKSGIALIKKELDGKTIDVESAREEVAKGNFQFCIVVPQGVTSALKERAKSVVGKSLSLGGLSFGVKGKGHGQTPELLIYFDPALREAFRAGIVISVEKVLLAMETEEKIGVLSEVFPRAMEKAARKAMGPAWSEEFKKAIPGISFTWENSPIITVREGTAQYGNIGKAPSTVQQNVPAWTLFGMFFVVVPLGASLIRERQDGMLARLLTMPVSYLTIISGKIGAYVAVCMTQFVLIMGVGKILLPLLGAPALDMGSSPVSLLLIALVSALAASGYGILLGTIARTYEQASTFGAVSVVIAAALGGIMVPLYVMPRIMQSIGAFSPLAWSLNAFLTVFVRGGGVMSILPELGMMLLFFVATTVTAWFYMFRLGRIRIH